jgi:hypothetical protein
MVEFCLLVADTSRIEFARLLGRTTRRAGLPGTPEAWSESKTGKRIVHKTTSGIFRSVLTLFKTGIRKCKLTKFFLVTVL